MGIVDEDVVRVRDAMSLHDVVGQYVQLKRVGRRWVGLCPFHAEKTGSFNVNDENGFWHCFGCQLGGDVITFIREIEHLDFVGAVEFLAGKVGIGIRYTERAEDEGRKRRTRLIRAMEAAVEWYHERLLKADDAGPARGYLRSRGLDGEAVRTYRIGWAPEAWDELSRSLRLPPEVMVDAGLSFLNRRGKPTDAFRGRVLFPIFDANGDPVAFGGRILPGGEGPKYKNSPESAIYSKAKVLYGLNWAKGDIVRADEAIVCEGYTDVIGFAAAGMPRAVATCGTALTEEHLRILKRFARRVVLAFDADAAGQDAAARFYAWERTLELEVAVADLPAGVDPADVARSDPERLRAAVEGAVPFLGFRVGRALAAGDLSTPEGRARAADAALAVVAEHPSELVRDQYLMEVAGRCRFEPAALRGRLASVGTTRSGVSPADLRPNGRKSAGEKVGQVRDNPELEVLRHLLHNPDAVDPLLLVDPAATELLFTDGRALAAFRAIAATEDTASAIAAADPGAAELLARLAVEETDSDPEESIARVVREATLRAIPAIERAADDPLAVARELATAKLAVEDLDDPHRRRATIEQLLTWLGTRSEVGG